MPSFQFILLRALKKVRVGNGYPWAAQKSPRLFVGHPRAAHDFFLLPTGNPWAKKKAHGLPINKILKAHFNLFDYFRLFHFLKILLLFIIIIYSNIIY